MSIFIRLESIFLSTLRIVSAYLFFYYMELPNFLHFPSPWVARRLV